MQMYSNSERICMCILVRKINVNIKKEILFWKICDFRITIFHLYFIGDFVSV